MASTDFGIISAPEIELHPLKQLSPMYVTESGIFNWPFMLTQDWKHPSPNIRSSGGRVIWDSPVHHAKHWSGISVRNIGKVREVNDEHS